MDIHGLYLGTAGISYFVIALIFPWNDSKKVFKQFACIGRDVYGSLEIPCVYITMENWTRVNAPFTFGIWVLV